jgi:hypothetical protein
MAEHSTNEQLKYLHPRTEFWSVLLKSWHLSHHLRIDLDQEIGPAHLVAFQTFNAELLVSVVLILLYHTQVIQTWAVDTKAHMASRLLVCPLTTTMAMILIALVAWVHRLRSALVIGDAVKWNVFIITLPRIWLAFAVVALARMLYLWLLKHLSLWVTTCIQVQVTSIKAPALVFPPVLAVQWMHPQLL